MKYALAIILYAVWVYILGAFVQLNLNPIAWSQQARELATMFLTLLSIFSCIWVGVVGGNRKTRHWGY